MSKLLDHSYVKIKTNASYMRRAIQDKNYYSSSLPITRNRNLNSYMQTKGIIGNYTRFELTELFEEVKGRCYWCNKSLKNTAFHADHYIPIALGGPNFIENIRISCPTCNHKKLAKDPLEFAKQIGKEKDSKIRDEILKRIGLDKEIYFDRVRQQQNPASCIKICYLDLINAYGFMSRPFKEEVIEIFRIFNDRYFSYGYTYYTPPSRFGTGVVWVIDKIIFESLLDELYGLGELVKIEFITRCLRRKQKKPSSAKFVNTHYKMNRKKYFPLFEGN